jgi:dTDP-4-dehydrorhamnose reductase
LEDADVLYLQNGCFDPRYEIDIHPFDTIINIHWPTLDGLSHYILSRKDAHSPMLTDSKNFCGDGLQVLPLRRILIIGASGQVGGALVEAFGSEHVIGTYSKVPIQGMVHYDLETAARDADSAEYLMTMCKPEIVIISGGSTWVDGCESNPTSTWLVNCDGPRCIARAARACGARTVYFSTDYVFAGDVPGHVYTELDDFGPVNLYGKSKVAGEKAVLEEDERCLVIRTTGVYGPEEQGKNFVYQLCSALAKQGKMMCADDNFGTPTYNRDLASIVVDLLESNKTGVYHCAGDECLTRYSFAVLVAKTVGLDASQIQKVSSDVLYTSTVARHGFAAVRGSHLGLASEKIRMLFPDKKQTRSIKEALRHWNANQRGRHVPFINIKHDGE